MSTRGHAITILILEGFHYYPSSGPPLHLRAQDPYLNPFYSTNASLLAP